MQEDNRDLAWTGERLVTGVSGDVAIEHLHRYALAKELARDKIVLDLACGEGYGSNLLSGLSRRVIGVDISADSIRHASRKYIRNNLEFRVGAATDFPVESESIDLVVSFETLEHLVEHEVMMAEIKRVLAPGGMLIMSTPNRRNYSDIPGYSNPFHLKELYADAFADLISRHFGHYVFFGQRRCEGSLLVPVATGDMATTEFRSYRGNFDSLHDEPGLWFPIYMVTIASDEPLTWPPSPSLFEGEAIPSNKDLQLEERDRLLGAAAGDIYLLRQEIDHKQAELERQAIEITERNGQIAEKGQRIAAKDRTSAEWDRQIAQRDDQIARRDRQISELSQQFAVLDGQTADWHRKLIVETDDRKKLESKLAAANQELSELVRILDAERAGPNSQRIGVGRVNGFALRVDHLTASTCRDIHPGSSRARNTSPSRSRRIVSILSATSYGKARTTRRLRDIISDKVRRQKRVLLLQTLRTARARKWPTIRLIDRDGDFCRQQKWDVISERIGARLVMRTRALFP